MNEKLSDDNSKQRSYLSQVFFPTRSRLKLQQSTNSSLNEQVAKLNQRAVDVRLGIEQSLASLHSPRSQQLTTLNAKTQDLEKEAATLEYTSSKHLKQELEKSKRFSCFLKLALALCSTLFSFMLGYMLTQFIRDRST